jgi:hypothetical protein
VQVRVIDRLARGVTDVYTKVVTIRAMLLIEKYTKCGDDPPDRDVFVASQRQVITFMTARDDQRMTWGEGKSVRERSGQVVLGQDVPAFQPLTEDAVHGPISAFGPVKTFSGRAMKR